MNQAALFKLTYGLFVITAHDEANHKDNGCIINTAMQVTDTPNRIVFGLNKANYTHDLIQREGIFNLSVLSEEASFDLIRRYGFQSGRDVNKFEGFTDFRAAENGVPVITRGTNAYLSCRVKETYDIGTHTLFLSDITDMEILKDVPSATYAYYHAHIKPQPVKTPKNGKTKTVWRCRICGYIYDGIDLPADFICPICKHGAADFEKVEVPAE